MRIYIVHLSGVMLNTLRSMILTSYSAAQQLKDTKERKRQGMSESKNRKRMLEKDM